MLRVTKGSRAKIREAARRGRVKDERSTQIGYGTRWNFIGHPKWTTA